MVKYNIPFPDPMTEEKYYRSLKEFVLGYCLAKCKYNYGSLLHEEWKFVWRLAEYYTQKGFYFRELGEKFGPQAFDLDDYDNWKEDLRKTSLY